jgi:hypothetical protein
MENYLTFTVDLLLYPVLWYFNYILVQVHVLAKKSIQGALKTKVIHGRFFSDHYSAWICTISDYFNLVSIS